MTFTLEEFNIAFDRALKQAYNDGWQAGYIHACEITKEFAVNNIQYLQANQPPILHSNIANLDVEKYKRC